MSKEYYVVRNRNFVDFSVKINRMLRDGWDVSGGICVVCDDPAANVGEDKLYMQSLVREKSPKLVPIPDSEKF